MDAHPFLPRIGNLPLSSSLGNLPLSSSLLQAFLPRNQESAESSSLEYVRCPKRRRTHFEGEHHILMFSSVLGMLIEVTKKGFLKHIDCILPVTSRILRSAIDAVTSRQADFQSESIVPHWKEAYYSLVMLEKMVHQFQDLCFAKDREDIWEAICEMLLHPHSWIRNRSVRLIALYFAHVTAVSRENQSSLSSYFIMSPSRLFLIATSLCCQLKMPLMDDSDSNLMTQNIVFAICGVHSLAGQTACIDPSAFWDTLAEHEKDRFLRAFELIDKERFRRAFELIDSRKGISMFMSASLTSFVCEDKSVPNVVDDTRHKLVLLLLKKMGKTALLTDAIQMGIVFNNFGT